MSTRPPKLPDLPKQGLPEFRRAVTALRRAADLIAGGTPRRLDQSELRGAANRFEEALRDRRRLMKRLAKVAPDDPVLEELRLRDEEKPKWGSARSTKRRVFAAESSTGPAQSEE